MSKTKISGDQKRKTERKASKAAAKAIGVGEDADVELVDAGPEVKKEKKQKKKKEKVQKEIVGTNVEKNGESKEKKEKNAKREEKQQQRKEPTAEDDAEDSPTKKRKRNVNENELEIDVSLPQPPSKKALRKLKKHPELAPKILKPTPSNAPKGEIDKSAYPEHSSQARSKHGIWIGNLAFSTTADTLREFIALKPEDVTRVNLPTDERGRNKGFAYIDFSSAEALDHALKLSESLLGGRKVLIKNSKDFSKRPASTVAAPKNGARTITMEYGRDPSVRYKKRFGGKDKQGGDEESERPAPRRKEWKDNRSADVGAAYSSDVRRTGAITASKGKKMTFDD